MVKFSDVEVKTWLIAKFQAVVTEHHNSSLTFGILPGEHNSVHLPDVVAWLVRIGAPAVGN